MSRAGAEKEEGARVLADRLRCRRGEIEQALLTRIRAISDPRQDGDPEYVVGLRGAVEAGLSYALSALDPSDERLAPVPQELLLQARRAARVNVGLDTVVRRYVACHSLLDELIVREADAIGAGRALGQGALRAQGELLDRLIQAVIREHKTESETRALSGHRHRVECVEGLLAGDPVDATGIDYDLEGWHLGVIAAGREADCALRAIAAELGGRTLIVPHSAEVVWGWLGGVRRPARERLASLESAGLPSGSRVSLGEPGHGPAGWRLTHRQAAAALPVARCGKRGITRYTEVGVLAAVMQDETAMTSLYDLYLGPLSRGRDSGKALRETLYAYFKADRNSASAAAALGVARQTVHSRLRTVEDRLGQPLSLCGMELEAAIRLDKLGGLQLSRT